MCMLQMAVFVQKAGVEHESIKSASTVLCLEKLWSSYDDNLNNSVDQRNFPSDSDIEIEVLMNLQVIYCNAKFNYHCKIT